MRHAKIRSAAPAGTFYRPEDRALQAINRTHRLVDYRAAWFFCGVGVGGLVVVLLAWAQGV